MLARLRFLIAVLAALAVPVQAATGLVMTIDFAGGSDPMLATVAMGAAAEAAEPGGCPLHGQSSSLTDHGADCTHCGFCHLATTGFLPSDEAQAPVVVLTPVLAPFCQAAPSNHIPEPPQQPPRRPV